MESLFCIITSTCTWMRILYYKVHVHQLVVKFCRYMSGTSCTHMYTEATLTCICTYMYMYIVHVSVYTHVL